MTIACSTEALPTTARVSVTLLMLLTVLLAAACGDDPAARPFGHTVHAALVDCDQLTISGVCLSQSDLTAAATAECTARGKELVNFELDSRCAVGLYVGATYRCCIVTQPDATTPDAGADTLAPDTTTDTLAPDATTDTLAPDTTTDTLAPDSTADGAPPSLDALARALHELIDRLEREGKLRSVDARWLRRLCALAVSNARCGKHKLATVLLDVMTLHVKLLSCRAGKLGAADAKLLLAAISALRAQI
ncbi:MAG: hypothetical protein KC503_12175 [Myxococcales bacterium]|nr:hypothetical protein [Myxococcales bacterium]